MGDETWANIQRVKSNRERFREKIKKRRAERETLLSSVVGGGGGGSPNPVLAPATPPPPPTGKASSVFVREFQCISARNSANTASGFITGR